MNEHSSFKYLSVETTDKQTLFVIKHPKCSAIISQFGGQLLSFKPNDERELIWLSDCAVFNGTKAIRGGVPICWPWFGKAPESFKGEPQHGYARTVNWTLTSVEEHDKFIRIELSPVFEASISKKLTLSLKAVYTFSHEAKVELITTNLGATDFNLSMAIHSYFHIGQTSTVDIPELMGSSYLDKLTDRHELQHNKFKVEQAMDRIYQLSEPTLSVHSASAQFNINMTGHDSVVIWNPWQQGAQLMTDFDDRGYLSMLCIEAALTNGFLLRPGQVHKLCQIFSFAN